MKVVFLENLNDFKKEDIKRKIIANEGKIIKVREREPFLLEISSQAIIGSRISDNIIVEKTTQLI